MLKKEKAERKRAVEPRGFKFVRKMGWIFSMPALVVEGIFGWFPISVAFIVAFQKFYIIRPCKYVGLDNFKFILHNPLTLICFKNTLYYAFLSLALTFLIPIFVAILLMEMKKSTIRIMMVLWFIPVASMAGLIIWKWFYNVQYGLFNGILISLGLPTLRWLDDPKLAMICLVLPGLIMYGPGLIYIATLQTIPEELYEAAELEGSSFWQKIWHITLPRIRPIMAMMLLLAVIGAFQVFQSMFVMTGGGPNLATISLVMYLYQLAFENLRYGRATALAVILFFILMVLVTIQRKCFKENIDV